MGRSVGRRDLATQLLFCALGGDQGEAGLGSWSVSLASCLYSE